ncbi:biofilm PGA synthesis N-glycosyltransferase PgaC [Geodermatophilus pulveris]|uniref:Biofilm PGA synthesis N-glycosyltransferase PgaC n=1 Tax=Geodermatophilus pulveris TaxID=1564159 RepID=A0A239JPZ6_9ACTN|nr:bifunctional polysaccharide deacetylase/glycosyltransferase family 2 protein [Geodermatophilus pulveris]SNT06854.1 biofilm PGA synthesis N-glycosyltransferase PgaC [Geodermatophilus pulveris]
MGRHTPARHLPVPGHGAAVFANPSGRRWRRLRAVLLGSAAALVAAAAVLLTNVLSVPALAGEPVPDGPTVLEVGAPPVVGEGPLVRVVRLLRVGGVTYGQDPFAGQVVAALSGPDAAETARSEYALQRHGYDQTPQRTISLTFDDGPHPVYTPRLLDLLSAHGVPATFFVTGDQMVRHPEIMRRIVREGHALGNHSLTHIDVNTSTAFRERAEIVMTDRIMRAGTGRYASYFRLPYEGDDEQSMRDDAPGILRAQQLGYTVVSHDFDPHDWAYASGERAGDIPLPPLGRQDDITVLLHDAGGSDRSMTLAYVERLVGQARAAGYTFTSMPQVSADLRARTGEARPTAWDHAAASLATVLFVWPDSLLSVLFVVAVATMLGLGLLNTVLALVRARTAGRRTTSERPPVAVLIAAYNEELVIARTLGTVLASQYPVEQVVVVDDGSSDATADQVLEVAARDPRVRLVRQPNGGKWAALNRGLRAIPQPFVVTIDADTLLAPTAVGALMARFHRPDVGAVAGVVKVGNHARNLVTRWQALEYVTQIGVDRAAAALLDAVMVVPGACAAWRTDAVLEAGGYSDATLAEDCDLTLMLHRHGWRVEQADDAVALTEAPETVDALLRQRVRWVYGTLQAVWRHRDMVLRPRYGWLGMLTMPMTVLTVLMPMVFTPFVAVVLVQMLAEQGPLPVLGYFAAFSLVYGLLAVVAVGLLRERPAHLLMVPLYRLIYEPLRAYLLYASLGTALRGVRLGWNKLARTANMDEPVVAAVARPGAVRP